MKEAMPYMNIYATEEIPEDMREEVEAENAAKAEQEDGQEGGGTGEEGEEPEEDTLPEGYLTDPNTGEQVKMPTEEEVQSREEDGILGGIESPLFPKEEPEEPEEPEEGEGQEDPEE